MRKINVVAFVLGGLGILAILAPLTLGQPGSGGGGRFGGGGKGGFGGGKQGGFSSQQDPEVLFQVFAKGHPFFLITEARSLSGPLTVYAQEKGISNGQISRQQFMDFYQQLKSKADGVAPAGGTKPGGFSGGPGGTGPRITFGGPGSPGGEQGGFGFKKKFGGGGDGNEERPTGPSLGTDPAALHRYADAEFKQRDRNNDGKLVPEEMPDSLKSNLARWDRNGDKLIDIEEYREYFIARLQGSEDATNGRSKGIASIVIDEEDLDRKPVVYRVGGKMPPGLPDWFKKLDTDNDGQVAMYEWRIAGKSPEEFKTWDRNDDGFITAEEAARQNLLVAKESGTDSGSLGTSGYDARMGGGGKGKGGFSGFGGGKGGFGKSDGSSGGGGFGGFGKKKKNNGGN